MKHAEYHAVIIILTLLLTLLPAIPHAAAWIDLLEPDGAEQLSADSNFLIRWQSEDTIEQVVLEYSVNNGQDWLYIDTAPNTSSYLWLVPHDYSQQCLINISDANNLADYDISDTVFTIYQCGVNS